jgi:hypothetical protein
MDFYGIGQHEGDLPTHLLSDESGNRIRAIARLHGDENVYYAFEAPDDDALNALLDRVSGAGSRIRILRPDPDWASVTLPSLPKPPPPPPMPSWIPWRPYLRFLLAVIEDDLVTVLERLRHELGMEGVAVVRLDDGRYLLELGADDTARLDAAIEGAGLASESTHDVAGEFHRL